MNKNKLLITVSALILIIFIALFFLISNKEENNQVTENFLTEELFLCLKDSGVVLYGSKYCPSCGKLIDSFGGYEIVSPIYIECDDNVEKCLSELKTGYVPEIQINGVLYEGKKDIKVIAKEVSCL